MRVVIDDAVVTSQLVVPLREGWVSLPDGYDARPDVKASELSPDDLALLPAGEATGIATTHRLVPDVAVVYGNTGAIAMRTPIRPDGIEETLVRLYHTSRTADLLIRALLRPFFGITAGEFVVSDAADDGAGEAQVVVIEGVEALNPPEAGFQEDLARAWFILTGLHLVSHVLVAPIDASPADLDPVIDALQAAFRVGVERRKEVRVKIAERAEIDRERLVEVTNDLRFHLEAVDIQSLQQLVAQGSWGTSYGRALPPLIHSVAD